LNAVALFYLVYITFLTPAMRRGSKDLSVYTAFFASLLFLTHPLQTGAVTYISQRFVSMATLFYLLSLIFYVRMRMEGADRRVLKNRFLILSLLCVIAAMRCKEISFTAPFAILLYEWTFFEGRLTERIKRLLPYFLLLGIIPLSLLYNRFNIDPGSIDVSERIMMQQFTEATSLPRLQYLMTEFSVVATYLRLLFLPVDQHFYYNFPAASSFFERSTLLSFLLLASIFTFTSSL